MLCNFQYEPRLSAGHLQCIQDRRQMVVKLDVDDSANDSYDAALYGGLSLSRRLCRVIPSCSHTNSCSLSPV